MRMIALMTASLLALSTPAQAGIVLSDNFDAENGGIVQTNYTGFANFTVIGPPGGGTVDIRGGLVTPFGARDVITCAGGSGSCVDLDGHTNSAGGLRTRNAYSFNAGDRVTLSFDFSGNQRQGNPDAIFFGFEALGPVDFLNLTASTSSGAFLSLGNRLGAPFAVLGFDGILATDPFDRLFYSFRAGTAGSIHALVGDATATPQNPSTDNIGAIVDNFQLDIAAVPEPASWAMMITGFGLVGGAMQRTSGRRDAMRHLA